MTGRLRFRTTAVAATILVFGSVISLAKKNDKCDEPKPEDMCTAANTCGGAGQVCTVTIRKFGDGATVKPSVPDAKNNQFFCVKAGTKVVWMTSSKGTGFMVSFGGETSPFEPDDPIMGGGSKPITVTAQNPGCYKYSAGAFYSGAVAGMSGGSSPEMVILP